MWLQLNRHSKSRSHRARASYTQLASQQTGQQQRLGVLETATSLRICARCSTLSGQPYYHCLSLVVSAVRTATYHLSRFCFHTLHTSCTSAARRPSQQLTASRAQLHRSHRSSPAYPKTSKQAPGPWKSAVASSPRAKVIHSLPLSSQQRHRHPPCPAAPQPELQSSASSSSPPQSSSNTPTTPNPTLVTRAHP